MVQCLRGALAMQFNAVEAVVEIEQMAVDVPALAVGIVAGPDPGAVWFEEHLWQSFERFGGLFPGDGIGMAEEVDVKMVKHCKIVTVHSFK